MDVQAKLAVLADLEKYDASCAVAPGRLEPAARLVAPKGGVCHCYTPNGRCVSLLKILLTNYCIYNCQYCVNRISSDTSRARFTVGEVGSLTMEFYKRPIAYHSRGVAAMIIIEIESAFAVFAPSV